MPELLIEMGMALIIFVGGVAAVIGGVMFKHRQKKD